MNERARYSILRTLGAACLVAAALGLLAAPADAAKPPANRTYFAVLVGVDQNYDLLKQCVVFTDTEIRSLDGEVYGTWWLTEPAGAETTFAFDMSMLEDGEPIEIRGYGRLDSMGGKVSSLGGAGHLEAGGTTSNFSFAARQTAPRACQKLLVPPPPPPPPGSVTESRAVANFHAVSFRGVGRLIIEHTGTESLTITAQPHILRLITSEVAGGWLNLDWESTGSIDADDIIFRLTVETLDAIDVTGVGAIDIRGLDTPMFSLDVSGVAAINAAGTVDEQVIRMSGVSTYHAGALDSRITTVNITGVCRALVRVSELLRGRVNGPSVLEYLGNPTVDVTGTGVVRKVGD